MRALPVTILYTQDAALTQRFNGYLLTRSMLRSVDDSNTLDMLVRQYGTCLIFVDLRGKDADTLLPQILRDFPETLVVAVGLPRSDPGLAAATMGCYAIEEPEIDRLRFQALFDQAQAQLHLLQENRILREEVQQASVLLAETREPPPERGLPVLSHFSSAFRRFDNVGIMLESIVEGVASAAKVSRVGIVSASASGSYRFRSGVKCLNETQRVEYDADAPFVRWLELHAHTVSRPMLRHIERVEERLVLERALDLMGAEVIMPLFGRNKLLGWLFFGRSVSGVPFSQTDLEGLSQLAEHVSIAMENALLHENIALEKALADTLLQAIPVGIIAIGANARIRWFNSGAEKLLHASAEHLIGEPVERLPSYLSSVLLEGLGTGSIPGSLEWTEPLTRRKLSILPLKLIEQGEFVGAMAVLRDLTEEQVLREKQTNLERAVFWTELAAAISHEVRNPLVAISTFAQLLPERYADEEFRTQFKDLTAKEVGRLNGMIDQLDEFANQPSLQSVPCAVKEILEKALADAWARIEGPQISVTLDADDGLPDVLGDAAALADAVTHLLLNAFAATEKVSLSQIHLEARRGEISIGHPAVLISVSDNGKGIDEEIREKIFSPFCTTKARGVGLGLPIVRRTMIDHSGLVNIESRAGSTAVMLSVPAVPAGDGA